MGWKMEWKMEWNSEHTQLQLSCAAQSRFDYLLVLGPHRYGDPLFLIINLPEFGDPRIDLE